VGIIMAFAGAQGCALSSAALYTRFLGEANKAGAFQRLGALRRGLV